MLRRLSSTGRRFDVLRRAPSVHCRMLSTATLGHHDLGGLPSLLDEPVPADEPLHAWEVEVHAMYACLAKNGLFSTDETRRTIENFSAADYNRWSYYEKFSAASASLLREGGYIKPGELESELYGEMFGAQWPSFDVGAAVVVRKEDAYRTSWRRPHLRTPGYLFGARGVVERFMGEFADPTLLAYGVKEAPTLPLYRVRFRMGELWSEVEPAEADSTVTVDLYASWLHGGGATLDETAAAGGGESEAGVVVNAPGYHHRREASHEHAHHHDGHAHDHGTRQQVERAACEAEGPPRPGSAVHAALKRLVLEKGLVSAEQLRKAVEGLESARHTLHGATLVATAWSDPAFKRRLLADANAAAAELGIVAANPNAPTQVVVVENDAKTHNLVVCTLCSCYPASLLGPAPLWYKSSAYRTCPTPTPAPTPTPTPTPMPKVETCTQSDLPTERWRLALRACGGASLCAHAVAPRSARARWRLALRACGGASFCAYTRRSQHARSQRSLTHLRGARDRCRCTRRPPPAQAAERRVRPQAALWHAAGCTRRDGRLAIPRAAAAAGGDGGVAN